MAAPAQRRGGGRAVLAAWLLGLTACTGAGEQPDDGLELELAARALREGRWEEAGERVAAVRARAPRHAAAAQWGALLMEMAWRDDEAIAVLRSAVRTAGNDAEIARCQGRLGDLLFQAGRYVESVEPLRAGAAAADAERRRAFAELAALLPFQRTATGPVLVEQPLLPGAMPEFVCAAGSLSRPFAIDTGTSMTTLSRSFADELAVQDRRPAGSALDGAGRTLPIEIGVLPAFALGGIEFGAVPVLVIDDAAMQLRDLHGGPERVPRGVLGLDLLAACRLSIDPERGSVVLEVPRGLPADESVQCLRVDGRCLVPVFVDDVRMWFVLDTGASHSSLTEAGLLRLAGGEARAVPAFRRVRTVGGALVSVREVQDLSLRCSMARFVGVTLPVVARGGSAVFPVHGVFGIDLLGRCRGTLDRGRLRLQVRS